MPSKNAQPIGKLLAAARKDAGVTQEQLAERLDVDVATISRTENNRQQGGPKYDMVAAIAGALDLTVAELVAGAWKRGGPKGRERSSLAGGLSLARDTGDDQSEWGFPADTVVYRMDDTVAATSTLVRTRAELEAVTGIRADATVPIFVEGDGMEPEIRANSVAWMRPMDRIDMPGIYYIEMGGHNIVKRIDPRAGRVLRVSGADRRRYSPEDWEPMDADESEGIEEGTFRSMESGKCSRLKVHGRLVAYTRVT